MPMRCVANCFISSSSSMQQWANHTSSPTHSTSLQGILQLACHDAHHDTCALRGAVHIAPGCCTQRGTEIAKADSGILNCLRVQCSPYVLARATGIGALAEVNVLLVLGKVCVQANARVPPCKACRLYHQLLADVEGRAGCQSHAQHGVPVQGARGGLDKYPDCAT